MEQTQLEEAQPTAAETTLAEDDPFNLLLSAGSDGDLWLLIGGPALLLALIIAVYAILVGIKNRRERRDLARDIELESARDAAETSGVRGEVEAEVEAAATPQELPMPSDVEDIRRTDRESWLKRLRGGLAKTRESLAATLGGVFNGRVKIDQAVLDRLHEGLYRADVGVATTEKLVNHVRTRLGREEAADWAAVSSALRDCAAQIMLQAQHPITVPSSPPLVVLIVGVNGVGKTTSIGKLAAHYLAQNKKVLLAAGDTFRAAAIEQLSVWGERLGVDVIKHKQGADPAAVAYDAVKAAMARGVDVLLIDTAGRLHAKTELMAELGKINRVIGRDLPEAPHETWLVIDATTGQNAVQQVKAFREVVKLTGLVVTKLDGTAKGGVLLGIIDQFGLPIRYVGVGEKASDLRAFEARDYVESLF